MANKREILIFENRDKLADSVLGKWREISGRAIKDRDCFTVAVSGGKAPVGFYRKLAACKSDLPWDKTHIFLVDERFVPFDDAESNYGMIRDEFLHQVEIPAANVHPIPTGKETPRAAAEQYEKELKTFFQLREGEFPVFDLVMLGIGEDGHTASLFPGTPALVENKRLAIETELGTLKHRRISLTLPVINKAGKIIFLVAGGNAAGVFKKVIEEKNSRLPAAMVVPEKGELLFMVDEEASSLLLGEEVLRREPEG
ncbi:MAG: 6-phosphogluconolactonase [Nitrospirae bacterium]|nr:6-phosphogluconolactonase [Nitrospirota bacterium]